MKAYLNLRYAHGGRSALFKAGLKALGYKVEVGLTTAPKPGDIFVTWNRIGAADNIDRIFEREGNTVLVAENASWGNSFAGKYWYHISNGLHNTAGRFNYYGADRFSGLKVDLAPWRKSGETVILPQRGIGSKPVSMPPNFVKIAKKDHGGRVRNHPGMRDHLPLEQDLLNCGKVVTWGSGAAIKALMMGIPVESYYENWIGKQDNTDEGRVEMFNRLAWAQWDHDEIKSGKAFQCLLDYTGEVS